MLVLMTYVCLGCVLGSHLSCLPPPPLPLRPPTRDVHSALDGKIFIVIREYCV